MLGDGKKKNPDLDRRRMGRSKSSRVPRIMGGSQDIKPVAFLFDLDGTLVDSVYQHVLAWREAMHITGLELAVWRIHRQIGMSGGLMIQALFQSQPGGIGGGNRAHSTISYRCLSSISPHRSRAPGLL